MWCNSSIYYMLTSRLLLGNWLLNWTEIWPTDSRWHCLIYAVVWPHLIGWGHPTYYNSCYIIEGRGHLYYKVDTKIETIKPVQNGTARLSLLLEQLKFHCVINENSASENLKKNKDRKRQKVTELRKERKDRHSDSHRDRSNLVTQRGQQTEIIEPLNSQWESRHKFKRVSTITDSYVGLETTLKLDSLPTHLEFFQSLPLYRCVNQFLSPLSQKRSPIAVYSILLKQHNMLTEGNVFSFGKSQTLNFYLSTAW